MPRLYQVMEIEKVAEHDADIARMIREDDERLAAAKKVRFDAWYDEKKGELDSLIAEFRAGNIGVGEYGKREREVEAELEKTIDDFEPVEDDKALASGEDELESVPDVEIFGARSSRTGKVAAMSAKKATDTKVTTGEKDPGLSMEGWTPAIASKIVSRSLLFSCTRSNSVTHSAIAARR